MAGVLRTLGADELLVLFVDGDSASALGVGTVDLFTVTAGGGRVNARGVSSGGDLGEASEAQSS